MDRNLLLLSNCKVQNFLSLNIDHAEVNNHRYKTGWVFYPDYQFCRVREKGTTYILCNSE